MAKPDIQVPVSEDFGKNITYLTEEMRIDDNFDVIHRKLEYAGRRFGLFFLDAFGKDDVMLHIMRELEHLEPEEIEDNTIEVLVQRFIPFMEVETTDDLEDVITQTLAGPATMIVEGCNKAIVIDIRQYPARDPGEPDIERVVRGPRDGFVETIVFNAELIRRRVRDRSLVMQHMQIGKRSKSDVVIAYIDSIADMSLVDTLEHELQKISIDGISMAEKTLEEYLFGRNLNPYPMVRYTERADTSAVHLMEGHVLILVDGSPSVMICPTTYWHHMQHAEEYRQKPIVGAFLRWVRFVAVLASIFLLPLWLLVATNPDLLPDRWDFIGAADVGNISLFWQFLIAEIGIEILRMAAIHTPNALVTALGLVAAILIGEIAVEVGLFTPEVILYIAVVAMSTFATPSYEMSLANRIFRIVFLIAAALFGPAGLIVAITLWAIMLTGMKTLNTPYLWPFLPFDGKAFLEILLRYPVPFKRKRPTILHTSDMTKQSGVKEE